MRLLVSVRSAMEAHAATAGGADVVDAKEPDAGALGAVPLHTLRAICAAVNGARAVTAALGDAEDEAAIERAAHACAAAGASLVKIGFAGVTGPARVASLLAAARRGAIAGHPATGVIAVGYADSGHAESIPIDALLDAAAAAGAAGVLADTARKDGPGLRHLIASAALASWARCAHDAGLLVAMAGRLAPDDLCWVRDLGADIAGVRGAACDGGRSGTVTARRVRALSDGLRHQPA